MCRRSSLRAVRRGLTLTELLLASAVMSIIAGTLAMLSVTVETGWTTSVALADALQHGRIASDRLTRRISTAYASEYHPGVAVVVTTVDSYRYPDTLVVWSPSGTPANPTGMPKISECYFYCPNPSAPNELLEITAPGDTRDIPLDATLNTGTWPTTIATLKTATTSTRTVLTNLLRIAQTNSNDATTRRGCARFEPDLRPNATNWSSYRAGTLAWTSVPFAQTIRGTQSGMRQVRVRFELQLMPEGGTATDTARQDALPVFGSAAFNYKLSK